MKLTKQPIILVLWLLKIAKSIFTEHIKIIVKNIDKYREMWKDWEK